MLFPVTLQWEKQTRAQLHTARPSWQLDFPSQGKKDQYFKSSPPRATTPAAWERNTTILPSQSDRVLASWTELFLIPFSYEKYHLQNSEKEPWIKQAREWEKVRIL